MGTDDKYAMSMALLDDRKPHVVPDTTHDDCIDKADHLAALVAAEKATPTMAQCAALRLRIEQLESVLRAERERCARAVCEECRDEGLPIWLADFGWSHRGVRCNAAAIWALPEVG